MGSNEGSGKSRLEQELRKTKMSAPIAHGILSNFAELQELRGISDTPRGGGVRYPAAKDDAFFLNAVQGLQPTLEIRMEQDEQQAMMDKYLTRIVDGTNDLAYAGTMPILGAKNAVIGSRLYFNFHNPADARGQEIQEKRLSNGLVVAASRIPLNQRGVVAELAENSRSGYHTLFVMHEQGESEAYHAFGGKALLTAKGQQYAAAGSGRIVLFSENGGGSFKFINLNGGKLSVEFPSDDVKLQPIAYWAKNPMFGEVASGLGNGYHVNGKFIELDRALEGKPLLMAHFVHKG